MPCQYTLEKLGDPLKQCFYHLEQAISSKIVYFSRKIPEMSFLGRKLLGHQISKSFCTVELLNVKVGKIVLEAQNVKFWLPRNSAKYF